MATDRNIKWDIASTISAGNKTYALGVKYRTDLEARLQPDELEQLNANTTQLELLRSGQTENLIGQKSKTLGQAEAISALHDAVISIRGIVKGSSAATSDILKAYGVGEKINPVVSIVIAAGNTIISAYNTYTAWSNSAGIIEADITEISDLVSKLSAAEKLQDTAMFTRRAKTMDKNTLQRTIEDEVTKISALGQHIFRAKDATVAKLFEELIPSITKAKTKTSTETTPAT